MNAPSFAMICVAEVDKVFSRLSARVGLLVSVLLGFVMPFVLFWLVHSGMEVNGVPSDSYFDGTPTRPLVWALTLRNLLLVRVFLVVLGAQSLAGELGAHTLREDLLRPVARWKVLIAKWSAILAWDAVSLGLTFVAAALPSLLLLGTGGPWLAAVLACALNLACDAGVVAVVLALAVVSRSTVATVGGMLVGLMVDQAIGWGMYLGSMAGRSVGAAPLVVTALEQWPLLPSAAFSVWTFVLPGAEPTWSSVGALVAITVGALLVGAVRLERMDVP